MIKRKGIGILLAALILAGCGQEVPQKIVVQEKVTSEKMGEAVITQETTPLSENQESVNEEETKEPEDEGPKLVDKAVWDLSEGEYAKVNDTQNSDIDVYGNLFEDKLIVVDGEQQTELNIFWGSHPPAIIKGDFNNDGNYEYLLSTLTGTGTGVYVGDLYLITDISDNENNPHIYRFNNEQGVKTLNERIKFEYTGEEAKIVKVYVDGAEYAKLSIGYMVEQFGEYKDIDLSCIFYFEFENNIPVVKATTGIFYETVPYAQYEANMTFSIPVLVNEDNSFSLGEISGEEEYNPY